MLELSPMQTTIATAAGFLGMLQGIVWLIFSIVAIVSYNVCNLFEVQLNLMGSYWGFAQRAYFMGSSCEESLHEVFDSLNWNVLRPHQVFTWMCIYLFLSTIWIILSGLLIYRAFAKRLDAGILVNFFAWSLLTIIITCVDIVMGSFLARDFVFFDSQLNAVIDGGIIILAGNAFTFMCLAFRGFVLIIINMGFAVYLLYQTIKFTRNNQNQQHPIHKTGALSAFDSGNETSDWWNARNDNMGHSTNGHTNPSYVFTPASGSEYERSHSWHEVKLNQRPVVQREPLKDHESAYGHQQAQPSALRGTASRDYQPYTPAPDYSPPPQRQTMPKPNLKPYDAYPSRR